MPNYYPDMGFYGDSPQGTESLLAMSLVFQCIHETPQARQIRRVWKQWQHLLTGIRLGVRFGIPYDGPNAKPIWHGHRQLV